MKDQSHHNVWLQSKSQHKTGKTHKIVIKQRKQKGNYSSEATGGQLLVANFIYKHKEVQQHDPASTDSMFKVLYC